MGQALLPAYEMSARKLASSLEDIADRLGRAGSAAEFVAVVDENRVIWEKVRSAAGRYGWRVPRRLMDFSLASSARARRGLSDHDVEAMISINRSTSSTIMADGYATWGRSV
jgi:hypothetical protein